MVSLSTLEKFVKTKAMAEELKVIASGVVSKEAFSQRAAALKKVIDETSDLLHEGLSRISVGLAVMKAEKQRLPAWQEATDVALNQVVKGLDMLKLGLDRCKEAQDPDFQVIMMASMRNRLLAVMNEQDKIDLGKGLLPLLPESDPGHGKTKAMSVEKAASASWNIDEHVDIIYNMDNSCVTSWVTVNTCHMPKFEEYYRPLLVAEFGSGINGDLHALESLKVLYRVMYVMDIQFGETPETLLKHNLPPDERIHFKGGKLIATHIIGAAMDCNSLQPVDIFISSLPCPFFVSHDMRHKMDGHHKTGVKYPGPNVFTACLRCVESFAKMGLKLFLLEMNPKHEEETFLKLALDFLRGAVPWFEYRVEVTNSRDHGLAEDRPILLLIGYHRCMCSFVPGLNQPLFEPMEAPRLQDVLELNKPKLHVVNDLTLVERQCVMFGYWPKLHERLSNPAYRGNTAILDIASPSYRYSSLRIDVDRCPTLTCQNKKLVVISLGEGCDWQFDDTIKDFIPSTDEMDWPWIFRVLCIEERSRLKGFQDDTDYGLSPSQRIKASGNVVGRILAPYLFGMIQSNAKQKVPLGRLGVGQGDDACSCMESQSPDPHDILSDFGEKQCEPLEEGRASIAAQNHPQDKDTVTPKATATKRDRSFLEAMRGPGYASQSAWPHEKRQRFNFSAETESQNHDMA